MAIVPIEAAVANTICFFQFERRMTSSFRYRVGQRFLLEPSRLFLTGDLPSDTSGFVIPYREKPSATKALSHHSAEKEPECTGGGDAVFSEGSAAEGLAASSEGCCRGGEQRRAGPTPPAIVPALLHGLTAGRS